MANLNVYQMVTDRIVEMMNQGIIPWEKPWKGMSTSLKDCAISYTSRKPYSLLNQILLGEEGEYITFNECTKLGGKVKKGAKSRIVVFFKPLVKKATAISEETGEEIEIEIECLEGLWDCECYDGYAICENIETGRYVSLTYPKKADIDYDTALRILHYRGLYNVSAEDITYGDIMMLYGEIEK